MTRNILDYFKLGLVLDQTQPKKIEKNKSVKLCKCCDYLMKVSKEKLLKESQCYGVTLTLKKKYHLEDPKYMHRQLERYFNNRNWHNKKYIFVPEFTTKGLLHYHGIIWGEYQVEVQKRLNAYSRKYGWVKPEYKIRYTFCDDKKLKYPKCCWYHYIWKSNNVGLWTINKI